MSLLLSKGGDVCVNYLKRLWREQHGNAVMADFVFAPWAMEFFIGSFFIVLIAGYVIWANYVLAIATWDGAEAESRSPGIGQEVVLQTIQNGGITSTPSVTVLDNMGSQIEVQSSMQLQVPDGGVLTEFGVNPEITLQHAYMAPRWWDS
jgi:hypothetical protein